MSTRTKTTNKRASTSSVTGSSDSTSAFTPTTPVVIDRESITLKAISFPEVDEKTLYESEVAIQKNLLLLGKSGSGKTTLFEVLKNPKYVTPTNQSLFAGVRLDPEYTPLVVRNQCGKAYSLNVIDTPGLFEVRANVKEKRSNTQIFSLIEDCLRENLTKISSIFILVPATSVLNEEDLEMLRLVKEFLGESFTKNTFLVFTKSDMFKLETLKVKISEFLDSAISQPFIEFCQGGIFFSGAVSGELAGEYGEAYEQKTKEKVCCLRQYLIDGIVGTEDRKLPSQFGLTSGVSISLEEPTGNLTPIKEEKKEEKKEKDKKK